MSAPAPSFCAALLLSCLLGAPPLHAAPQDSASASAPGQTRFGADVVNPEVRPAERPLLMARGRAIAELLLATPALTQPRGFALNAFARVDFFRDSVKSAGDPFPISGSLLLRKIDLKQGAKPDAEGRFPGSGEGPAIQFHVNDLLAHYGKNAAAESRRGGDFQLSVSALQAGEPGVMRIGGGLREFIVVAQPGRSPFVHVTQQEFLTGLMQELYPDGVDASPKPGKGLAKIQAELAALSAAQRAAPACTGGSGRGWLSACEDRGAVYRVKANLDYFDRSKPRHLPQLITLVVPQPWVGEDREEGERLRAAAAELDLGKLRAMLG